jgi:hypothetical protein
MLKCATAAVGAALGERVPIDRAVVAAATLSDLLFGGVSKARPEAECQDQKKR